MQASTYLVICLETCMPFFRSWSAVGKGTESQCYDARYHSQEGVLELRDEGSHEEEERLRDGAGLGYDESKMEKTDQVFYENITR